ncbi:MAG: hypothetical protein DIU76_04940 [Bacillota bacterium]|nr:MAG: hypothetical protein DIU76_04940 [Bacillota bacterium]
MGDRLRQRRSRSPTPTSARRRGPAAGVAGFAATRRPGRRRRRRGGCHHAGPLRVVPGGLRGGPEPLGTGGEGLEARAVGQRIVRCRRVDPLPFAWADPRRAPAIGGPRGQRVQPAVGRRIGGRRRPTLFALPLRGLSAVAMPRLGHGITPRS